MDRRRAAERAIVTRYYHADAGNTLGDAQGPLARRRTDGPIENVHSVGQPILDNRPGQTTMTIRIGLEGIHMRATACLLDRENAHVGPHVEDNPLVFWNELNNLLVCAFVVDFFE